MDYVNLEMSNLKQTELRILKNLVKGSLTRQKLQNSNGYTKSPEFSPALGLIIFGKKSVATNLR